MGLDGVVLENGNFLSFCCRWGIVYASLLAVATGAMYGTGTKRRQEGVKADVAKRKRDGGSDILNPQIRALEAMDEALDTDNNMNHNIKGQEAWRMNGVI